MAAGFDAITNHISLILFPIGLDLLIWFLPRLSLMGLINKVLDELTLGAQALPQDGETAEMFNAAQELWTLFAEQFNLLVFLRSYPVGIPSLMSSILPMENPLGALGMVQIESPMGVAGIFLLLSFLGLLLGTFYFKSVYQAAVLKEVRWRQVFLEWPWLSTQIILLTLFWVVLLVGVSIPASCVISVAALGNVAFGQCGILMYAGLLVWVLFPLLFSAHGIFVNSQKTWHSIKRGVLITRMTLPITGLFFAVVLLLSQGLDFLWRIPPEKSWLMLIGLAGHGFVSTGLLSTSFIYYREADRWVMRMKNDDVEVGSDDQPDVFPK
jgi:hypothetical protein